MASVSNCEIKDLSITAPAVCITCLIIAKTEPRHFYSKIDNARNGVITLTVRDSKRHFINCTIWGSDHFIDNCALAFRIGDVITIDKPRITANNETQYAPLTTVPFLLTISEGKGQIYRPTMETFRELTDLFHESVKPTSHALYLADIMNIAPNTAGDSVDLVVLVRAINPPRQIKTKKGERLMREIYVMDSTNKAMLMTVWNNEYIQRANDWKPLETILHLVDVRASYSSFNKRVVLSISQRTIVTENPLQSSKAKALMEFVCGLTQDDLDDLSLLQKRNNSEINLEEITTVMTVQKIIDLSNQSNETEDHFTALIYALVTIFNIDAGFGPISSYCALCNAFLRSEGEFCGNQACVTRFNTEDISERVLKKFNIAVNLSDHTGTLTCRLMDQYAANVLKCSVDEFLNLNDNTVDELKGRYCLNRFGVKLLIKRKTAQRKYAFAMILDIFEMDPHVMAASIKSY